MRILIIAQFGAMRILSGGVIGHDVVWNCTVQCYSETNIRNTNRTLPQRTWRTT